MRYSHYHMIADLFDYPGSDYYDKVAEVIELIKPNYPEATLELEKFYKNLPRGDQYAMSDLYSRTFDMQAFTCLDVGYMVFGEDYKRGELLANLSGEFRKIDLDYGTEMPDHLSNFLRLISKLEDDVLRVQLVENLLAPAVMAMRKDFEPASITEKNKVYKRHFTVVLEFSLEQGAIFGLAMRALELIINKDFSMEGKLEHKVPLDFMKSVEKELEIEKSE